MVRLDYMRILLIASLFVFSACSKDKEATCSFIGSSVSDGSYEPEGLTVNKYTCDAGLSSMNCTAYQTGSDYFRMNCEQKNSSVASGAPANCSVRQATGTHIFLDGSALDSKSYDCGVFYGNLSCIFYSSTSTTQEEMRCNLL